MPTLARVVSRLGIVTTSVVALVYIGALAGVVVPLGVVLAVSFPILVLTALVYILRSRASGSEAPGFRWWMPVVWVLLIINSGIVGTKADRATSGGHVEEVGGRTVLVTHGRVIRELDSQGVRDVHLWDLRQLSGHMLLMLSFTSLGLLAVVQRKPELQSVPPAP